jgi:hypothetical protein
MDDNHEVYCPFCGERIELYVEAGTRGWMVVDCEVRCNPMRVRLVRSGPDEYIEVRRADGSD